MHMDRPMFVFGSDRAGRHLEGAALEALRNRGAVYGQGAGPQGNSYAIPTRCEASRALPRDEIANGVMAFLDYTHTHPWLLFDVTPIGCDLAGHGPEEIAPMFAGAPHNVTLPRVFTEILAAQSSS